MALSREGHVSLPVVALGIAAAGVGLYFVLKKAPATANPAAAAGPPVAAPVAASPTAPAPQAFTATSSPAQDAHDANAVNDILATLVQQAPPSVQQAMQQAAQKAAAVAPIAQQAAPIAQQIAQQLPVSLPKNPFGF